MKQFKQRLSFILVLCIFISMVPVTVWAANEVTSGTCGDNLNWTLGSDGVLTISGEGTIPDFESADAPWQGYSDRIRSLKIENGITRIGNSAFYGCKNMENAVIPDSVMSIGNSAFEFCSLTSVVLGTGVVEIGDRAFGYNDFTNITLPDTLRSIGASAFTFCQNLTSIVIPHGVTTINSSTFHSCIELSQITISSSITHIGNYAFGDCLELASITLPNGLTTIADSAFSNCIKLSAIVFPESVTTIGGHAFYNCPLTSIRIPSNVSSMGESVFNHCMQLKEIMVDESNQHYASEDGVLFNEAKTVLLQCPSGKSGSYAIPVGTTELAEYAFAHCSKLTSVMIPETVASIGRYAFYGCSSISALAIPSGVTEIASHTFYECSGLNSVTLPVGITKIGEEAFLGCVALQNVVIPDRVSYIGQSAFENCSRLMNITIPEGITCIYMATFGGCSSLKTVNIPKSVNEIVFQAFRECTALTDVYFSGTQVQWNAMNIADWGNDPIFNATIHCTGHANDSGNDGSVYYFAKWDADNQIAYFDLDPSENPANLGSQVTEETDTSFLEKVNELVGTYVLAETKIRDDGMLLPDTLISILPVETKSGTVTANDSLTISIDGVEYAITEQLGLVLYDAGDMVTYHLYNGELVGIRDYDSNVDNPELPDAPDSEEPDEPANEYHMVVYPHGELTIEVGETLELTCSLYNGSAQVAGWEQPQLSISHKEDIAPLYYEGWEQRQAGGYTLNVKGVSPGIAYLTIYDTVSEDVVEITIEVISGRADSAMNLNVNYWDSLEKKEKIAQVNWGYKLFGEDARNIENADPESFAELVKISALLANSSYDLTDGGYLQHLLGQLGAENIEIENSGNWDISNPAHSISHVEFYQGGIQKDVVIVTIRGSTTVGDWITDFVAWAGNFWDSPKEHEGFSIAKNKIKKEIKEYLSRNGIDASETKILIAGHSYGAAVANLLANSLEDVFAQGSIYAYTFASPNNIVVDPSSVLDYLSTDNIHNFRNVWDPVTRVPIAPALMETYTIFGEQHFFELEEIGDTSEGVDIFGNHNCTHYVNYALNLVEHNAVDSLQTRCVQIHCPVDVTAYDGNGNVVGQITNNQLNESSTNIMMFPVSDQKNIFVDQNEDVQLSIVATDPGTMDVIITEYDVVTGNVSVIKKYSGIGLIEGKDFYTSISDETVTADIVLEVVDDEGNRLAVVNEDGTETADISEKHKHSTEIQNIKEATCTETGYSGDEVCSECGTVVKKGFEISTISHDYKAVVTNPTCTADGYTTYTCSGCGDTYVGDPVTKLGHDMSDPTCTEAAMCQREGCDYTEGSALDHSFTDYVSNKDATCIADGTKTATCDRCDKTDTLADVGSAKGHNYADATCTASKICKICGTTDGEALGHVNENADKKCDRCSMSLETEQSGDANRPSADNPQTGDSCSLELWITLLMLSFACAIVCICCGKKRNLA